MKNFENSIGVELIETYMLSVSGLVQGIGFRPFVFRLAKSLFLNGSVTNRNDGVLIRLQGDKSNVTKFIELLVKDAPLTAFFNEIKTEIDFLPELTDFIIENSASNSESITQISPDIAVCENCLKDMHEQANRLDYSLINCTNCGPRFSIVTDIPYDRKNTSMHEFVMCENCLNEYTNIEDRRFHAQPVACNNCGPEYSLLFKGTTYSGIIDILKEVKPILEDSGVVALKGLGGYHLVCNPFSEKAVNKLRAIKKRDGKPFAIMFCDVLTLKKYAMLSLKGEETVKSWRRPILLLPGKEISAFAKGTAEDMKTIGAFLPYMPFHYQLFKSLHWDALILTSANRANCPIITDDSDATRLIEEGVDAVVMHNRTIVNRVDDSVVIEDERGIQILRRARGYTPEPIYLKQDVEGILATGAELTDAFCIGKDNQAIMSQYIGDLKNMETMQFFEDSLKAFKRIYRFKPVQIACDMHPDYISTRFAEKQGLPLVYVQHHHAHIAACMAEYQIDEPVIGVSYDGTGYGTDGRIWGSEIMIADLETFERKFHFEYSPLPGGDIAVKEPWRIALSYLYEIFRDDIPKHLDFLSGINLESIKLVLLTIKNKINTPESCSAGRLFDAISALLNICTTTTYHAQAPVLLEQNIMKGIDDVYAIKLEKEISWKSVIQQIISDINSKISTGEIAAKFHNTVASITSKAIFTASSETGIKKVILSGGTFQNIYLLKKVLDLLKKSELEVFVARKIPLNDSCIALGQIAIASKKNKLCV